MGELWQALGAGDTESWLLRIITAPALYAAVGLGAWVYRDGWADSGNRLAAWFTARSGTEQALIGVGVILAAMTTGSVISGLAPSVLRLLEGYWPRRLAGVSRWLAAKRSNRLERKEARWQELSRRYDKLTAGELDEFVALDLELRRAPVTPGARMPTKLGNTLRASERWPKGQVRT